MGSTILYIDKINGFTYVHYINGLVDVIDMSPLKYLNKLCLQELTTLEGRLEAIKCNFNIVKNVPIYITENLVLFSTNNKRKLENKYINSIYIKYIKEENDKTKIVFYDDQFVYVQNSYHIVNNSYEKCLKIKKQINQFY